MVNDITRLLEERGKQHGAFSDHARTTQRLKRVIADELQARVAGLSPRLCSKLTDMQAEALDMIVHKIGRIIAGDPNHVDHWDDIAGYSTLVANELRERAGK